jgi:hypothetical protein
MRPRFDSAAATAHKDKSRMDIEISIAFLIESLRVLAFISIPDNIEFSFIDRRPRIESCLIAIEELRFCGTRHTHTTSSGECPIKETLPIEEYYCLEETASFVIFKQSSFHFHSLLACVTILLFAVSTTNPQGQLLLSVSVCFLVKRSSFSPALLFSV